ncbi:MAG: MBL fold metallo-hydrolase, partial [Bdellovibrionales bacterium]|nr:MBL fold metallo-hydrolase [Bdellovibrionales bacterium]
ILIDCGAPLSVFEAELVSQQLELAAIFITHHHADHVEHLDQWLARYNVPVCCHPDEQAYLPQAWMQMHDNAEMSFGGLRVRAIHTPGHTAGHLCFLVNHDELFSGDTLFAGSVGATTGEGATGVEDLRQSIVERILRLSHAVRIRPGHGEATTVIQELRKNPFVRLWRSIDPALKAPCQVRGTKAFLLCEAADYDGGSKALVRFLDSATGETLDAVVPGSWLRQDAGTDRVVEVAPQALSGEQQNSIKETAATTAAALEKCSQEQVGKSA